MSNEHLGADEARKIQEDASAALRKIHTKHAGRDSGSIAEVENENYQPRKSDAEKAIAKLHSTSNHGVAIAKRAAPALTNASSAISAMHAEANRRGSRDGGRAGADRDGRARRTRAVGLSRKPRRAARRPTAPRGLTAAGSSSGALSPAARRSSVFCTTFLVRRGAPEYP